MKKRLFCMMLLFFNIMICMAQNFGEHQVVRGESLEYIAQKYGVTVDEIKQNNQLLDQYFYVGQKLKIPIKEQPKVEYSNYTYSSSSWEESKPVRKQRSNNGWKQFWSVVGSAFAAGFTGYGHPMMYNPYSYQGGGNMDYLIDPNYTLMQMQPQIAQMQAKMAEDWRAAQKSQQYLQSANNAWQSFPQGTGVWNMPVMTETPLFVPESTSGFGTIGTTSSSSNYSSYSGASCYLCNGLGKCRTCNGKREFLDLGTGKWIRCSNCTDGLCSHCHGSGKK